MPGMQRYLWTIWLAVLAAAGPASGQAWQFVVLGDHRGDGTNNTPANPWVNTPAVAALAQQITAARPALVLLLGDMIHNWPTSSPSPAEQLAIFTNAFAPVTAAGIPVYAVRGNHEYTRDLDGAAFRAAFPGNPLNGPTGQVGLTFSVAYSNALFVGLDEYSDYAVIRPTDQDWLAAQLAARPGPHVFVFGHTTAFALSNETSLAAYPEERDALWRQLTRAGSRIFFGAHVHCYDRASIALDDASPSIQQVIVGAGGAPFSYLNIGHYPDARVQHHYGLNSVYGYLLVDVAGNRVRAEYRGTTNFTDWAIYDSFEATVAPALSGDFDGDRLADPALYTSDNTWYLWLSGAGYNRGGPYPFGLSNAAPCVGDFDGDRKADPAVSTSNGDWYVWLSGAGYAPPAGPFNFSAPDATPAPADFDGDGKADPAVYRDGYWLIWMSGRNYAPVGPVFFGAPGYAPAPADFDGDGQADPAVYGNGLWGIWMSGRNYAFSGPYPFSVADGETAVPADYDGDGKADPAVESRGQWYAWLSGCAYARFGPFTFEP
jgi:hypothetical protein